MTDRPFDPTADAQGNYTFAHAMMRLRTVITGERFATEHDEFYLIAAASLARLPARMQRRAISSGMTANGRRADTNATHSRAATLMERQRTPVVVADTPEKRAAVWEWLHRNRAAAVIERQRDVTA